MVSSKKVSTSTKNSLIEKAGSRIFVAVAIGAVIISSCLVTLNLLWSQARFNNRVQNQKEAARDTLIANIEKTDKLAESYKVFQNANAIVPNQGTKTNTTAVLDALPSRYDFPAVATSVQNIATLSKVALTDFSGSDLQASNEQTSTDPEPIQVPFDAEVVGSYDSVKAFVVNLEKSIRPYVVTAMSLEGSDANITLKISAYTYYQPAINLDVTTKEIQ